MATPIAPVTNFSASGTRPMARPLTERLEEVVESWARSQYELVTLAAEFAASPEWLLTGSPTPAHWLAIIADVEPCTTREWIRIGRKLVELPAIADAFKTRAISYSKVRTLTRLGTADNEQELLAIATTTTAADLGRALAAWLHRNSNDEDLAEYHQQQRSVKWRTEPDGMVSFSLRLPPLLAGILIAFLTSWVMRTRLLSHEGALSLCDRHRKIGDRTVAFGDVQAGLGDLRDGALITLLALNGLRISEALNADIADLSTERGHQMLAIVRKGGEHVTIPIAPSNGSRHRSPYRRTDYRPDLSWR